MGKIYYYIKKDPNNFEGKDKISFVIYNYLKKYYNIEIIKILDKHNFSYKNADIIHINSSGILEAIRCYSIKGLKIYSLYSNLKANPIYLIKDFIDFFKIKHENLNVPIIYLLKRLLFPILLSIIPWFVIKKILERENTVVVLPNNYLYKKLKLKNAKIVPIGVDIKKFYKKETIKDYRKTTIAYVGHPAVDKGIIEVAKIFSKLDNKKFKKVMFLTNLNINIDYLKSIDPNIEIFGPQEDIVKVYNTIDILILPYRHEISSIAIPLVLIEAMACEVPIITSDLPHLREIGKDSLIYVKPFDIDGFVKEINNLANNPEKRLEIGKKARNIIEKHYNEKIMLEEYKKLYDYLLKRCKNE